MNHEKKERIKSFINKFFIEEIKRLQKEEFYYFSFILIGQAIEALGGLMDNKPLKAKGQSFKRFTKSINVLMPPKYRLVNRDNVLYDKLRNQMTHSFIPSNALLLITREKNINNYNHLDTIDKKLVLIAEDFHEDIVTACNKLFYLLDNDKIKPKMIADFDLL